MLRLSVCAVLAILAVCLLGGAAYGQTVTEFPDTVVRSFTDLATGWLGVFQSAARNTFYLLALISLAWKIAQLALRIAVMEEVVAELVEVLMFIGIGIFVLGAAPTLLNAVINSFRTVARNASGAGMQPSEILAQGLNIATGIMEQASAWSPATAVGLFIMAIVILLCIGFVVGCLVVGLVQVAIYVPVATFYAAFLGSFWTRHMAMSVLWQSFALGSKLMMLQLLAGGGLRLLQQLPGIARNFTATNAGLLIVAVLILAFLVKVLPDWIAGVVGGSSIGEARAVAAAAGGAAEGAVAGLVAAGGAGAATMQAARLASEQMSASEAASGAAPQVGADSALSLAGGAAKNLGSAMASDLGRKLAGTGGRHGSQPWRIADDLGNRRRLLADDQAAPRPPVSSKAGTP